MSRHVRSGRADVLVGASLVAAFAALVAASGCGRAAPPRVVPSETSPAASPATPTAEWPDVTLAPVLTGLDQPLYVTHAGDGSGRMFVVEKTGAVRVVRSGQVLGEPFLDVSELVSDAGEQGLLGLAFPPGYAESGRFYVNYTDLQGNTVVARYRATPAADVASPASPQRILEIEQPYANHNGGMIAFDPEGYLMIGMGDGGSAGDPAGNGQNANVLLGKMLRLDVGEATASPPGLADKAGYGIPPGNPFAGRAGHRPEAWSLGWRNPWRFSFDRETGDLWVGDVGQNAWEEIDFEPADDAGGRNYGWNVLEGTHPYPSGAPQPADADRFTAPVVEYAHPVGTSVTGGYVYRGEAYPALRGAYVYGDYGSGRVWGLRAAPGAGWENRELAETGVSIASFGEDEAGELYVVSVNDGTVYRLEAR